MTMAMNVAPPKMNARQFFFCCLRSSIPMAMKVAPNVMMVIESELIMGIRCGDVMGAGSECQSHGAIAG
jgi:hypothetical protein